MRALLDAPAPRPGTVRLLQAALALVLLLLWQLASRASPLVPAPLATLRAAWLPLLDGTVWPSLQSTMSAVLLGLAGAAAVAVPLGLALGRLATARRIADPVVTALFAVPRIVAYPLLLIVFGVGLASKSWLAALGAFFPILLTSIAGSRDVPERLVRMARSVGCGPLRTLWSVFLPACRPAVLASLRIGASVAFVTVIVAEMFAADDGMGVLVQKAYALQQYDQMFGGVAQLTVLALCVHLLFGLLDPARR